jgi:tRNA A-37 threonylcarbamoyl transferase component Bud32
MMWDQRLPGDVVAALWGSPESLLLRSECLQTKSRTTVARVRFPPGSYLLKFHHWAGFWKTLSKSRATSPNRLSFDLGVELADYGVPTPQPLACVDVRLGPFNTCSYLLTEFVEGTSLYRMLRYERPDAATIDDVARQVAQIWQQLNDRRLSHNDLKPENLMVDPNGRVWLIDLENAQRHKDAESLRHAQWEDAQRFLHVRSWQANPAAAEVFRERLLEAPAVQAAIADHEGRAHPFAVSAASAGDAVQRLTVLIPCGNVVTEICACVEAVRDFADEILVVVAGSSDGTWEVAKNLSGCRAIRLHRGEGDLPRSAIVAASHPWVLVVEPTERVTPDLAKEIQFLLAAHPMEEGYRIERRHHWLGHAMRFGEFCRDRPVRLVRRDGGLCPTLGGVRGGRPRADISTLRCRMLRDRAASVEQWIWELTERAAMSARELYASNKRASLARILFRAPLRFAQSYFLRLGCLDGWAGLHAATMSAASELATCAMLWQLQRGMPRRDIEIIEIAEDSRLKLLNQHALSPPHAPLRERSTDDRRRRAA